MRRKEGEKEGRKERKKQADNVWKSKENWKKE